MKIRTLENSCGQIQFMFIPESPENAHCQFEKIIIIHKIFSLEDNKMIATHLLICIYLALIFQCFVAPSWACVRLRAEFGIYHNI